MKSNIIRLKGIKIWNFKNVGYGELSFENTRKPYAASILGLYGQNGSGKTALIDALSLLKYLLMGQQVPSKFADCINVNAPSSSFQFNFKVICSTENHTEFDVEYTCSIRKDADENAANMEQTPKYKVTVFNEILSASFKNEQKRSRFCPLIDTRTDGVFLPTSKYKLFTGSEKTVEMDLLIAKRLTAATARTFIFSRELASVIYNHCCEELYLAMYRALVDYGNFELFIIDTTNSGLISINALPLAFSYENEGRIAVGSIMLRLNGVSLIPEQAMDVVQKVVASMNLVLRELVPGLIIGIEKLGMQLQENGKKACSIQLVSSKNGQPIPLQYESEGIKKIISVLNLLIGVYNRSSMTVAIDELDAGVFEYLLGELLRIIAEKGKGQLIFTSHNLRPLETIDKGFIAFTTTNPDQRYIRMTNVKSTNNLRDFYYRDIMLGEQNEPVYEPTNNYDIALALREAGDSVGA